MKLLILALTVVMFVRCQKQGSSSYRIGFILLTEKEESLLIQHPNRTEYANTVYFEINEGASFMPQTREPIFKAFSIHDNRQAQNSYNSYNHPLFFDEIPGGANPQYTDIRNNETYTLALYHDYALRPRSTLSVDNSPPTLIETITFKPSDYLPNSKNQITLTNGDTELVLGVY